MKYIYLTFDAIEYFSSIRQFQNIDYDEGVMLGNVLSGKEINWNNREIKIWSNPEGIIFYTRKIDKNRGLIFDVTTFDAFHTLPAPKVINIFQKVIKLAIKYFRGLAFSPCEKHTPDGKSIIVYPFPFSATKNVYKVLIDKNSSKISRKGKAVLTVYYSGCEGEKTSVSFTSLNKALAVINELSVVDSQYSNTTNIESFSSTSLDEINLTIDSTIGYNKWEEYLTNTQKHFINKNITGVERLEGAAGTGKTLSMILRCINVLQKDQSKRVVFVTHSRATRDHIIQVIINNWPDAKDLLCTTEDVNKPLLVTTLQEWCIKFLGIYLSDTEYLDRDAQESKILQSLYIEEAYSNVFKRDWSTYRRICSEGFVTYIESTDLSLLVDMLQYEIATIIKGRAEGDLEIYKKIDRPQYAIPCFKEVDRCFLYIIYKYYQDSLEEKGQYDSDDIILTALGQLNTPIWKRRRNKEGFNVCFIDETHLFNLNELSVFHYLNRDDSKNNIIFAIDKSQHIGERGILDDTMYEILKVKEARPTTNKYDIVFRNSPEIVNLAYNILSSGVEVFSHFENPLIESSIVMSASEEAKCFTPKYMMYISDNEMIESAFKYADSYSKKYNVNKSKILIATVSPEILSDTRKYADSVHKSYSVIKSLGDAASVTSAFSSHQYVIGSVDYVAGLEFDLVIVVGVDAYRVPPKYGEASFHYINYAWHNRMYVVTTRAKYALIFMGNKNYGPSPIIESAIELKIVSTNF